VAVALVLLAPLVAASVAAAWGREHRSLPAAATVLRSAELDAAALVSCFQGVQDDLLVGTDGHWVLQSVHGARVRLASCDTTALQDHLAAVDLPPAAPLAGPADRRARADLAAAASSLARVVLEARGTRRAMSRDLERRGYGAALVVGFRAMEADYLRAARQLTASPVQPA